MASLAARAERIAAEEQLSVAAAEKRVRDHDREVRARAQTLAGVDIDDPAIYHLVINTSSLAIEPLAAALVACAREVDLRASEEGRQQLRDAALAAQGRAALRVHPKFGNAQVEIRCEGGADTCCQFRCTPRVHRHHFARSVKGWLPSRWKRCGRSRRTDHVST
jgi:hypothetical protein